MHYPLKIPKSTVNHDWLQEKKYKLLHLILNGSLDSEFLIVNNHRGISSSLFDCFQLASICDSLPLTQSSYIYTK